MVRCCVYMYRRKKLLQVEKKSTLLHITIFSYSLLIQLYCFLMNAILERSNQIKYDVFLTIAIPQNGIRY